MSRAPGSLAFILPVLVKIFKGPGKFALLVSVLALVLLTTIIWTPLREGAASAYVFAAFALIGIMATITFAVRGTLLTKRVEQSERTYSQTVGTDIIAPGEPTTEEEVWQARFANARAEAANKKGRFFPRIEAAQRAGIAAAGGLNNAPFLKADLRITVITGLIALLSAPLGFFLSFVAALLY